jgi:hypothetical protein
MSLFPDPTPALLRQVHATDELAAVIRQAVDLMQYPVAAAADQVAATKVLSDNVALMTEQLEQLTTVLADKGI